MTREEAIAELKRDIEYDNDFTEEYINAVNMAIKALEQEPTTKNETLVSLGAYKQVAWERDIAIQQLHELGYEFGQKIEPTTKNDLGVDCIDRVELLKAMDTWDKFGYTSRYGLERLDKDDKGYVPYVKYDDMVNCVKSMPSVTPQSSCGKDINVSTTDAIKSTRFEFDEEQEQLDFVQPHNKIPITLTVGDAISRQAVFDILDRNVWKTPEELEVFELVKKLPPVTPRQATCEEREKGECPFYAG